MVESSRFRNLNFFDPHRELQGQKPGPHPALAQPAALEKIYAALTRHRVSVLSKGHGDPTWRREYGKMPEKTMSQTFEEWKLQTEADVLTLEAEAHSGFDHLHAFNFGRFVGRIEYARDTFGLRVRWLLWGAAVGVTLAAIYLQVFLSERILQMAK